MDIIKKLFELQDVKYGDFQQNLTPTMTRDRIIGVRVPELRKLAKEIEKDPQTEDFLLELPHRYYDEDMLHSMLLSEQKDYGKSIELVEAFLPYVDNWAVCDTMKPKAFSRHKPELLEKIREWAASERTYTIRFAIEMLMNFYLDGDFKEEYLEIPAAVESEEYYVRMMQAWFFATALAKQWDAAIKYIKDGRLERWTHNKTIQKARESYRITDEQKEYLKGLKR